MKVLGTVFADGFLRLVGFFHNGGANVVISQALPRREPVVE